MTEQYQIVEKTFSDGKKKFYPEVLTFASLSGRTFWNRLSEGKDTYEDALNAVKENEYYLNSVDIIHEITEKDLE